MQPDKLPLPLPWRRSRPASDRLPLPLANSGGGTYTPPQARIVAIRSCAGASVSVAADIAQNLTHRIASSPVAACAEVDGSAVQAVGACLSSATSAPPPLGQCARVDVSSVIALASCGASATQSSEPLARCTRPLVTPAVPLAHCIGQRVQHADFLRACQRPKVTPSVPLAGCSAAHAAPAAFLRACARVRHQRAVRPPCEYYPIPLPPPPPDWSPCRLRPPSYQLPLPLARVRIRRDSQSLRLPLTCWHDGSGNDLPNLTGYIMHNTITAEHNGQTLHILALTLKTDIDAYCWQADITLAPADFARLNIDGRGKGDEAIITLRINGQRFDIMAEDYRDTRRFVGYTYTVSGRSITARLGADYAQGKHQRYDQPRYARQIADEQLQYLPYQIAAWDAVDWLVSADAYTVSGQTPIAVIADIAHAAGAFVESHPYEPQLFVRPVWAKAAWEKPAPERTIPANLILSATGQRRVSEKCNAIRVVGSGSGARGALVYREGTDQTPEAGILTHALYTDDTVLRAAGLAALSETGTHKLQTVALPWADKYQLPLAELGKVWGICGRRADMARRHQRRGGQRNA